ncbi:MAG: outer membrane lipoprotein carrier protein LolA, partial [Pirellulaceae bacterium]
MSNEENGDWERLFQQLPVDTSARDEHRERLKARVLSEHSVARARKTLPIRLQQLGRTLMRYRIPHWTAATILVAMVVWLAQTDSTPAFELDQVVDQMMQAHSARFDMTAQVVGQPAQIMKGYFLEPNRFRQELLHGYINIADWQAGKMIGLDPINKQATVFNLVNVPAESRRTMQMNQFEVIRESMREAMANPDKKIEQLGEKQLDGRRVVGVRFLTGPQPMTLWADPRTNLPVRIEATMAGPPQTEVVMSNYEFNVDLDESLFRVAVPEGYQVVQADVDASPPGERDFLAALRLGTKLAGEFPGGLDSAAIAMYVAQYLAKQGMEKGKGPSKTQMDELLRIARGFQFIATLPPESEAHYAGAGVPVGDADRAIFWYRPAGSSMYRV